MFFILPLSSNDEAKDPGGVNKLVVLGALRKRNVISWQH
uniref:Uncharacterized protein n=1 Tax=Arundo donax TaxID=35708 RepID=A0A0A9DC77_ARUDO